MLLASYEAEQHLLHFGRSDVPVCWTICGLTSGYISRSAGKEIYVLEDRCLGKGDAACHLIGRTREEWGDERAEELRFFEPKRLKECLDVSLHRVTETLKAAERKLREHRRALVRVAPDVDEPLGIVAKSPAMRQLVDLARRVAKVDSTVLITGESGSGKERIARLVHDESTRAAGPFIAVNCGAITETLLESELFGHARGAFTGATDDRPGLFEAANGGTLLLDEVGEVSPGMQVKLLRALQEREIRRVGENKNRRSTCASWPPPTATSPTAVAGGAFRQDLYYRLKVVELHVPPLRERRDDILPLARVLLADAALRMKRKISGLAPAAADQLLRYEWPGNVRELENAMERAVALARGSRRRARGSARGDPPGVSDPGGHPGQGAAARRDREGVHPRGAGAERRQPDAHRRAAPHRLGDALPQAQELRLDRRQARGARTLTAAGGAGGSRRGLYWVRKLFRMTVTRGCPCRTCNSRRRTYLRLRGIAHEVDAEPGREAEDVGALGAVLVQPAAVVRGQVVDRTWPAGS